MSKLIVGSYLTEKAAAKAINIYELKGHEAKNIVALTNKKHKDSLDKITDVSVKSDSPEDDETSTITDKIKDLFTSNANLELDTPEKLVAYGLSEEDAIRCMTDVNSGKIVVLADDELRMGQAPPIDIDHQ